MRLTRLGVQPIRETHKLLKRGADLPEQGSCLDEIAAVGDQIPVTREPTQALHREEIDKPGLEDFVRRMRTVNHGPFAVVTYNRRATQPFQQADLYFLRA